LNLCSKNYYCTAKKSDILLECEARNINADSTSIELFFKELLGQGYIYEVKPNVYSIFRADRWNDAMKMYREKNANFE